MLPACLVGPGYQGDAQSVPMATRKGRTAEAIVGDAHGRYHEAAVRGSVYCGGNQAAVAVTAGLATTYTGLVLINPAGSGKNLSVLTASVATSAALSALVALGLIGGYVATGLTAFTAIATNLWGNANVGLPNNSVASLAAAGITLVGTPRWLMEFGSGFTTQSLALNGTYDVAGQIIVPPGGYCAFGATAAVTAAPWFSFTWEELPI